MGLALAMIPAALLLSPAGVRSQTCGIYGLSAVPMYGSFTNSSLVNTYYILVPFPTAMSVTAILVYDSNTANSNMEVGIYQDNGTATAPTTLLASAAYNDPGDSSTFPQTIAIGPVNFNAGNIWLAIGNNPSSTVDLIFAQTNGGTVTTGFTNSDLPSPVTGFNSDPFGPELSAVGCEISPIPTNTFTPTASATPTVTPTTTPSGTPTQTTTVTPTFTPTDTASLTPSATAISTATDTATATATATPTDSTTPTASLTASATPSPTATLTPTRTLTSTPTASPTQTPSPTITATYTPTGLTTSTPTPNAALYLDANFFDPPKQRLGMDVRVDNPGNVKVIVYNFAGEKVAELLNQFESAGNYRASWDGTNSAGALVGNGVYFIVIEQPSGHLVRKVIVLK